MPPMLLQMTVPQGKSTDDFPKGNNKTAYVKALVSGTSRVMQNKLGSALGRFKLLLTCHFIMG